MKDTAKKTRKVNETTQRALALGKAAKLAEALTAQIVKLEVRAAEVREKRDLAVAEAKRLREEFEAGMRY